jgi:hypothetical protein
MNVTAALTSAIFLLITSDRAERGGPCAAPPQRPSLIIPLQLKTDKLPIVDGAGRVYSIRAFHPGIGDGQLDCLAASKDRPNRLR